MRILVVILLTASLVALAMTQQCREVTRQVTVCDDDASIRSEKGDKGDVGANGKAGPPGSKGSKGDLGGVGEKGESCALGSFETEMRNRMNRLEEVLTQPTSCWTSFKHGRQTLHSGPEVFCSGGWTVFQRRFDGSQDFQQNWNAYKLGFGDLDGEFWLGLEKIYQLTKQKGCKLRIDLWGHDGDHAFAQYSDFSIEGEEDKYRLHVDGYSGTAGDSIVGSSDSLDNMRFSTYDQDHDNWSESCSSDVYGPRGGWWFNTCGHTYPNAQWGLSRGAWNGIVWNAWKGNAVTIKETTMKMRCD
ncbi:microfibril-associated glycoprotein 4-like [Clavelina lepadiformis]|uniref:microfibril-associated glycoprotein 4-like n=1 Tax=Clavelina lepadiformis TaxID=159417 RepID=UPI0040438060